MAGSIDKTFDCGTALPGFLGGGFTPTPGCDCPPPPPPPPDGGGGPRWDGTVFSIPDVPGGGGGGPGGGCECIIQAGEPVCTTSFVYIDGLLCEEHRCIWYKYCLAVGTAEDDPSYEKYYKEHSGDLGFEVTDPPKHEDCSVGGLCEGECKETVMVWIVCKPLQPDEPEEPGGPGGGPGGPVTPGPGGPGTPQPHWPGGPGGPATPGPAGPGTPKSPPGCYCRVVGSPQCKVTPFWRSSAGTSFEEIEGGVYCLSTVCTWQQECKYIANPPDGGPPDDPSFGEYMSAHSGEPGFEVGGEAGGNCIEEGAGTAACTGPCESIELRWYNCIYGEPETLGPGFGTPKGPEDPAGPATPGPAGPGTPKEPPKPPSGPTTPAPPGPGTPRYGGDGGGGLIIINPDDPEAGGGLLSSAQDKKSELSLHSGDRRRRSFRHKKFVGGGLKRASGPPNIDVVSQTWKDSTTRISTVDLTDRNLVAQINKKFPMGLLNTDLAIGGEKSIGSGRVRNFQLLNIFSPDVNINIDYLLKNNNTINNWNSLPMYGINFSTIMKSLNSKFLKTMRNIIKLDGTKLTDFDIYHFISSKLLDGTIKDIDVSKLSHLSQQTSTIGEKNIVQSASTSVNELVALNLLESNSYELAPTEPRRLVEIMKNWTVLAEDINKFISVYIEGKKKKIYVKDDNTFISRISVKIKDGDYINLTLHGKDYKIYGNSEKDHAFIASDAARQQAVKLMGGRGERTITVEADASSSPEFDYSLSTSRPNFYFMKLVPSSVITTPSLVAQSPMVKDTEVQYTLMDSSSAAGLESINKYIRYKANYRTYLVADDDLVLDYIDSTSSIKVKQEDIIHGGSKVNKSIPIFVRQIPWYIIVLPTNREEYNTFGTKSSIMSLDLSGKYVRTLSMAPAIDPTLSNQVIGKFITYKTSYPTYPDIFGDKDVQVRTSVLTPSSTIFTSAYRIKSSVSGDSLTSAEKFNPSRKKTTFRIIKEILDEFDDNYVLETEGIGKTVNSFDVVSRLTMTQFDTLMSLENPTELIPKIKEGLFKGIKVVSPVQNDGPTSLAKTRLTKRRAGAPEDTFKQIKSTNSGEYIIPSSSERYSSTITSARQLTSSTSTGGK